MQDLHVFLGDEESGGMSFAEEQNNLEIAATAPQFSHISFIEAGGLNAQTIASPTLPQAPSHTLPATPSQLHPPSHTLPFLLVQDLTAGNVAFTCSTSASATTRVPLASVLPATKHGLRNMTPSSLQLELEEAVGGSFYPTTNAQNTHT